MDAIPFLRSVLPSYGRYCIAVAVQEDGGSKKYVQHLFFDSVGELVETAAIEVERRRDVYFALSSFLKDERKAEASAAFRCFFLDLDVGEDKPHSTIPQAQSALTTFCADYSIPPPSLVCSGYGLHAYWALTDDVPADEWLPVATQFKAVCQKYELGFDPAVPNDMARILRVPGTKNFKRIISPADVYVMRVAGTVELDEFCEALRPHAPLVPVPIRSTSRASGKTSSLTAMLAGNRESLFSRIVQRSLKGTGCNAIRYAVVHQEEVSEPLWFSALSIAQHCADRDTAIHKMSCKYPQYNWAATEQKASGAAYPHTCDTFRQLAPELCAGCPHKVKSPIVLGHAISKAPTVEPRATQDDVIMEGELSLGNVHALAAAPEPTPVIPKPYFRGRNGGIYRTDIGEDDAPHDELIYEHDLFVIQRIIDPNEGEMVQCSLALPKDGVRKFFMLLSDVHSSERCRSRLGKNGVAAYSAQMGKIMTYVIAAVKELQVTTVAKEAHLQFGWTRKRDAFVAGNKIYTKNSIQANPGANGVASLMPWIELKGDLSEWRGVVNALARPGMEPLQFAAMCGFGSPLMPFSGVAGATVNLLSNASGTGKTTACQIANSVFGHPVNTMIIERDTQNSREHKMGVMNNLCIVADEMTNSSPEALSDMVYAASQGRGKDRMEASSNQLRANSTRWQLILLTNSNASMVSKLARNKARADGELMRLVELHVERVTIPDGDKIFDKLKDNYGVAGPIYAQWIVRNVASIQELVDKQKDRLWRDVGKRAEERHLIGTMSVVLVAGRIAQRLGLHDLDMDALEQWVIAELGRGRVTFTEEVSDSDSILGEFLNASYASTVGVNVNQKGSVVGTMGAVFATPRSYKGATVRMEVGDVSALYVSKKAFRDYCVDRQATMQEVLSAYRKPKSAFQYVGVHKKRLLSGTGITSPAVDTLKFICGKEEGAAMRNLISAARDGDDSTGG